MRNFIKYVLLLFISLGIILFPVSILTIKYQCTGHEVMPIFYGSPFIYKSTSLVTSLAYDYYIVGLIANWIILSIVIGFISFQIEKFISITDIKAIQYIYKGFIVLLLILSALNLLYIIQTRKGSKIELNANLPKLEKDWNVDCKGEFKLLTE